MDVPSNDTNDLAWIRFTHVGDKCPRFVGEYENSLPYSKFGMVFIGM